MLYFLKLSSCWWSILTLNAYRRFCRSKLNLPNKQRRKKVYEKNQLQNIPVKAEENFHRMNNIIRSRYCHIGICKHGLKYLFWIIFHLKKSKILLFFSPCSYLPMVNHKTFISFKVIETSTEPSGEADFKEVRKSLLSKACWHITFLCLLKFLFSLPRQLFATILLHIGYHHWKSTTHLNLPC